MKELEMGFLPPQAIELEKTVLGAIMIEQDAIIDMIEGLVFKRRNAKLEIGNTENNNTKSQVKCRKATKLYRY